MKIEDSAHHPPQFVTGVHASDLPLDGACAGALWVERRLPAGSAEPA
jgi:hypothetical protein